MFNKVTAPLKVYVASSWLNKPAARELMDGLEEKGCKITHDWTKVADLEQYQHLRESAYNDIEGIKKADCLVLLWPGRYSSIAEVGAAIALGKPVFLLGKPDINMCFFYHPLVQGHASTYDELLDQLKSKYSGRLV